MIRPLHNSKTRLLAAGFLLLILLVGGAIVTGRIINRTAATMSQRLFGQVGEYHLHLLSSEFNQTERALGTAAHYIGQHPAATERELQTLGAALLENDLKINSFGILRHGTSFEMRRGEPLHRGAIDTWPACDSAMCRIRGEGPKAVWQFVYRIECSNGNAQYCRFEIPLSALFVYMTNQEPHIRSYAVLYAPDGMIAYHPDSLRIGSRTADSTAVSAFRRVMQSGESTQLRTVSTYLGDNVEQIYYPLQIGGERWVASIGIPTFTIEREVSDFHRYTLLTALIALLLFAVLLIVAQKRWRHEYRLRLAAEHESEQLHLQQVIEQIDPHFLFNSLNSLYALIRQNPDEAREFTLTLGRVYRHVLEHRREILATLDDEAEFTRQYYSLQKIRFGSRIKLVIALDPAYCKHRIPAMSLQTLVENAVKHNRITADNPLRIRIATEQGMLTIENNYTPREDKEDDSLGVGLERIRSVYRFYTTDNLEIATDHSVFRCRLPLIPPEK